MTTPCSLLKTDWNTFWTPCVGIGMNIARLNFSHGSHEYHLSTINNVRTAAKNYQEAFGYDPCVAIALDTKGPGNTFLPKHIWFKAWIWILCQFLELSIERQITQSRCVFFTEIRTGLLEGDDGRKEVILVKGASIKITTNDEFKEKCSENILWVDYKHITMVTLSF